MSSELLENVHQGIELPRGVNKISLVGHKYQYYHYKCDGFNDVGWGCGYRTLQTLCSWVQLRRQSEGKEGKNVPSIKEIQNALVEMGDKEGQFLGSRDWIGSFEVAICLDFLYNVQCKIIHVNSGKELVNHIDELKKHFDTIGSPIMMGGDVDASSKGLLGICQSENCLKEIYFLILDPHYTGKSSSSAELQLKRYISWQPLDIFMESSFYNLCLPKYK